MFPHSGLHRKALDDLTIIDVEKLFYSLFGNILLFRLKAPENSGSFGRITNHNQTITTYQPIFSF